MLERLLALLGPHWHELWVIFYSLMGIWSLFRQRRYSDVLLARQEQQTIERVFKEVNETQRTLSTAFAQGEPQTLADLLSSAERDWSLRSYGPPSHVEDSEATVQRAPPEPPPRVSRPTLPPSSSPPRPKESPSYLRTKPPPVKR